MNEFYQQQAKRKLNFNEISGEVDAIISSIRKDKDSALLSYTNEFDNNQLSQEDLKLDKSMLSKSTENISKELLSSLKYAHDRILAYHKKLKPENLSYTDQIDIKIEQIWTPVESVGVRGKNCQYSIPCLWSFFSHSLASLPNVPHTLPPGKHEGCISTPKDFFVRTVWIGIF